VVRAFIFGANLIRAEGGVPEGGDSLPPLQGEACPVRFPQYVVHARSCPGAGIFPRGCLPVVGTCCCCC
jgi:hypothetical protein